MRALPPIRTRTADQGRPDAVLFVVGAKGAGKTTLVSRFLYPDKAGRRGDTFQNVSLTPRSLPPFETVFRQL